MSLYSEVLATGGYISNHCSDLYIEVNPVNTALIQKYDLAATIFVNQVTGKLCYDVSFAYEPFWDAVAAEIEEAAEYPRLSGEYSRLNSGVQEMITSLLVPGTWQHRCWNQNECTVVKLVSGGFGVLDHSIQTLVAKGDNADDCQRWIDGRDFSFEGEGD